MTTEQAKTRLERYAGLRLELKNRLHHLGAMQKADREQPSLCGSRAEEYARQIAPLIEANRRELAEIEAAVASLPDPLEREVLRLRYLEPSLDPQTGRESARHMPWNEIAFLTQGGCDNAAFYRTKRIAERALAHLAALWAESEQ